MSPELEYTEPGDFPGHVPDEVLAQRAIAGCQQLAHVLPEIRELRLRFKQLQEERGAREIAACRTWYQFCVERLDRTPSAIRKALAQDKKVEARNPLSPVDAVWSQVNALRPFHGDGEEHKFIVNIAGMMKKDLTNERERVILLIVALREISASFTVYANQLEDRIRVAGVA
jgi:hypothetical protein